MGKLVSIDMGKLVSIDMGKLSRGWPFLSHTQRPTCSHARRLVLGA